MKPVAVKRCLHSDVLSALWLSQTQTLSTTRHKCVVIELVELVELGEPYRVLHPR